MRQLDQHRPSRSKACTAIPSLRAQWAGPRRPRRCACTPLDRAAACLPLILLALAGCAPYRPPEAALEAYLQGQEAYLRGQLEAASATFARLAKSYPRFGQARLMEAKSLYLLGRPEEARRRLTQLITGFPRYREAEIWLARVEVERGRLAEAEHRLADLLAFDAQEPRALYLLALVRMDQGRFAEAISLLERCTAFEEELARVHIDLGRLYHRFDLVQRSRAELGRALLLLPDESPLRSAVNQIMARIDERDDERH